jgi:hypothetical protein
MVTSFSFTRFACHPTKRKPQDNSSTLKTFATLSLLFLESRRQYFSTLKHKPSTTQKNKNNDFLLPWNASIGPSLLPSRDFDAFCWASHHINIASQQWPFQAFRWPKKITKSSHSLRLLQIVTAAATSCLWCHGEASRELTLPAALPFSSFYAGNICHTGPHLP